MKVAGIAAEYNPFHNGHEYHLKKTLESTGADFVIAVMSGDFVQRGGPAFLPRHMRAKSALQAGVSLVLELPVRYATGSADDFAYGAVSLLNSLGCVDVLSFGSESGDLSCLKKYSRALSEESGIYSRALKQNLKSGMAYPQASRGALRTAAPDLHTKPLMSNDILAVSYLKSLEAIGSTMSPVPIERRISSYTDSEIVPHQHICSAAALRKHILSRGLSDIAPRVPADSFRMLTDNYKKRLPLEDNDFSYYIRYRLMHETSGTLRQYLDVDSGLAGRIAGLREAFINVEQYIQLVKTKNTTYRRVSRALFHILLGITSESVHHHRNASPDYAHILGFRREALPLLTTIKGNASIPLISTLSSNPLKKDSLFYTQDMYSSQIYESILSQKYRLPYQNPYRQSIIRL